MYCENCGAQINDNARFCNECGSKVIPMNTEGIRRSEKSHRESFKSKNILLFFLLIICMIVLFCATFIVTVLFLRGQENDNTLKTDNTLEMIDKTYEELTTPIETKSFIQESKEKYVAELENIIIQRCALSTHEPRNLTLINNEISILEEYESFYYEDPKFSNAYYDYYQGLLKQKESFDLQYVEQEISWLSGLLLKCEALEYFYREYTDFSKADGFKEKYLYSKEIYSEHLSALREINSDLNKQLHQDDVARSNYYTMNIRYKNNTKYDFDAVFYITYYDQNDKAVESTIESVDDLNAGLVRNLEFFFPYDKYGNGSFVYRIDWVHTAVSSGSWCGGQRQQCGDSGSGLR